MRYRHVFRVQAPQAEVAEFHTRAASLSDITPPIVPIRVHQAPEHIGLGDQMDFTMRVGPLPMRWTAQVEDVSPAGFLDRQVQGPFERWAHRHTFVEVDSETTGVIDEVEARLKPHLGWGLVGLGMWLGLPLLFAYRGWKTRRLLEDRQR
jgi:ligand-binding SRPBCC domain-containing protein